LADDRGEIIELAGRLVAAPSPNPPGDERAAAAVVLDALAERGLSGARIVSRGPERPNVVLTLDFGPGGRHLCLSGHLDTKPVGSARWHTDPFTATVVDGRLFGLGAVDMKGAIAAMICAAARVAASPPARGRLTLLFTADEEDGAAWGARYLAESGHVAADGVVIGEPGGLQADFDRLHLGSRGIARLRFRVSGDQGHASLSDRSGAVNASTEMARLLLGFTERFRPGQPPSPTELDGWTTTVTGGVRLSGGVGYGIVPGEAGFDGEVRTLPGMSRDTFEDELRQFMAAEHAANPRLRAQAGTAEPPADWLPATLVDDADPLVAAARQSCRQELGVIPPSAVFPGTTDAAFLQAMAGVPTLPALGPGLLACAHGADEWVSVNALGRAVSLYEALTRCFCAGPTSETDS
jgi:acetylornithine deacetylase/succinyl-diaminopimelate desuccinylase-like protein